MHGWISLADPILDRDSSTPGVRPMDEGSGVRGQSERSSSYCSRDRSQMTESLTRALLSGSRLPSSPPSVRPSSNSCSLIDAHVLRSANRTSPWNPRRRRASSPFAANVVLACFISLPSRASKTVIEESAPFASIDLHLERHRSPERCQMATSPACCPTPGLTWSLAAPSSTCGLCHDLRRGPDTGDALFFQHRYP